MSNKNLIEGHYDGDELPNEVLYQLIFEDLSEEEQISHKGKPIFWNDDMYLYPDGTTKHKDDVPEEDKYKCK